jgi:hypothetical protein
MQHCGFSSSSIFDSLHLPGDEAHPEICVDITMLLSLLTQATAVCTTQFQAATQPTRHACTSQQEFTTAMAKCLWLKKAITL